MLNICIPRNNLLENCRLLAQYNFPAQKLQVILSKKQSLFPLLNQYLIIAEQRHIIDLIVTVRCQAD